MRTLPISFHLRARTVVVVGGVAALATDLRLILRTGAWVRIVAEQLDEDLDDALRGGRGIWERRKFAPRDLHEAVLVLVATGSAEQDGEVVRAARVARVPMAVVDRPELSDFELSADPLARHNDLGTARTRSHNQPL